MVPVREWNFEAAFLHCDHTLMQSTTFIRRRIVERVGWLYPSWTHDQELWLRAALAGAEFLSTSTHLANVRVGEGHMHDNAAVMIPARIEMTRRFLTLPELPARFGASGSRALSNAYVRGFDLLDPRHLGDWKWGWYCLTGAIRTNPANTPHVVAEIVRRLDRLGISGRIRVSLPRPKLTRISLDTLTKSTRVAANLAEVAAVVLLWRALSTRGRGQPRRRQRHF
jgi:hypothetical protein